MEPSSLLERFYLNNCRKIFNKFLELNIDLYDATLMTDAGTYFKCHRFVLSACSPYFERTFHNYSTSKDISADGGKNQLVILLATYKSKNVQRVVDFIYHGKLPDDLCNETSDKETDDDFIRLAKDLKVIGLHEILIERQRRNIDLNHKTSDTLNNEEEGQCPKNHAAKTSTETLPVSIVMEQRHDQKISETAESDENVIRRINDAHPSNGLNRSAETSVETLPVETVPETADVRSPAELLISSPEYNIWLRRLANVRQRLIAKKQTLKDRNPHELLNEIIEGVKYEFSNHPNGGHECLAKVRGQCFTGKGSNPQNARSESIKIILRKVFNINFDDEEKVIRRINGDHPLNGLNRSAETLPVETVPETAHVRSPAELLMSSPEYNIWLRRLANVRQRLTTKNQTLRDKNPLELLNEIIEGVKYEFPNHPNGGHECLAKVRGQCFTGKGSNQQKARSESIKIILRKIFNINLDEPQERPSQMITTETFGDAIEGLILDKYKSLMSRNVHSDYKVIAGIVKTIDNDRNSTTVVSIGTGSKFLYEKNLNSNGNAVHDTHAEVVARRGLIRYIYNQISQYASAHPSKSIFEKDVGANAKLRLKSGIEFHLYVSTAPCGDARVHSHLNGKDTANGIIPEGQLRTKGQSALTVKKDTESSENVRNVNMSCSAKLLRWNILGIQGALLSELVEPIYFASMVFGEKFEPVHMKRALYGRIETDDIVLPNGFQMHQPELLKVSASKSKSAIFSPNHSVNWNVQGYDVEILESTSGCTMGKDKTKRYSRISKRAFFSEFIRVTKKLNHPHYPVYSDAKLNAVDYQTAKSKLFQIFENNGLGTWVQKRRRNLDSFTI